MDFNLPENTTAIRDLVREFSQKKIEPIAAKIDRDDEFPFGCPGTYLLRSAFPMTIFLISVVPAPISYNIASRSKRSSG